MNILAVGAHPDDLECVCFGTLAKYVEAGHRVFVLNVSNGNLGHAVIEKDELAKIREEEAARAANVIGAEHMSLGIDDQYVDSGDENQVLLMTRAIRKTKPELIITHCENDYHRDHTETYRLVFRATNCASLKHYDEKASDNIVPICPLYQMDTLALSGFEPTEFVDVSDTVQKKLEALSKHSSQIDWMREHDKIDFLELIRSCTAVRGFQCGVSYAEGFRADLHYGRTTVKRLLP